MLDLLLFSASLAMGQTPLPQTAAQAPMAMPAAPGVTLPTVPTVPTLPSQSIPTYTPGTIIQEAPVAAEEPKEEEKFFLQKLLESSPAGQTLAGNGWKVYGWTQASYSAGTSRNSNLPVPFIDRAREFSLNQNWLHIEKGIDTSKSEYQIGGAVDLILPGTDYRTTVSRNLLTGQVARGNEYGIDLFQAYADLFIPGLGSQGTTLRFGKFATNMEYELVQATGTPFLSRSYVFQYNPFTHTGLNAMTPLSDDWSMQNGIVLGNDNFFGDVARATYIGQLKYAPKEGKNTVLFNVTVTDPTYDADKAFNYYNAYNLQLIHKFSDKFSYVADATYSHMNDAPSIGFANWYGVANYLFYDVTDSLQSKIRLELFEDAQGYRTGASGLYTALTYGVTWKPVSWFSILPEVRYDHNNGTTGNGPFEGKRDQFTASLGAILRW